MNISSVKQEKTNKIKKTIRHRLLDTIKFLSSLKMTRKLHKKKVTIKSFVMRNGNNNVAVEIPEFNKRSAVNQAVHLLSEIL